VEVSGRKPKIVVIDDNEVVLEATKSALEGAGYAVLTHDRPVGCVALILHEKPDLVLMDVNMPGLGGDTIVSVLVKALPTNDTVLLLHSSASAEVLRSKAISVGAHGYIQKTSDFFALVRDVNRWLKRTNRNSSGNMRAALVTSIDDKYPSGVRPAAGAVIGAFVAAHVTAPPSSDPFGALASERRSSGTVRVDSPTLLLVDDDMTVLSGFRRCLQTEDIAVEFALSGGQALRRLLSDKPPDVVVCDMLLPDISGVDVYRRAVAADPSYRQRFAVATGASKNPAIASFLATFTGPVLHKPVDPGELSRAVQTCLSGARPFPKSGSR
jgi:CheY-like chemotaxis protein